MKLKKTLTTLLIASMAAIAANADTNITWESPETYRDATYRDSNTEKDRNIVLRNLEKYFVSQADRILEEGQTLTIKVTDVDLAGEFEPWRARAYDIRILKSIYPARLSFDYTLTAEDGTVIAEGSESLRDNALHMPSGLRHEDYPFVKDLFRDWVKKMARNHIS